MFYVGIDLTSAFSKVPRPIDVAILNEQLEVRLRRVGWPPAHLVTGRDRQTLVDMVASAAEAPLEMMVVAIDGPHALAAEGARERHCERVLRTPGKTPDRLPTPTSTDPFQSYIRSSIDLFATLVTEPRLRLPGISGVGLGAATLFEVFPGSEWPILSGGPLPDKASDAGRLRRRELLESLGLTGLPACPTADENDAAVAAVLAWCTRNACNDVSLVGEKPHWSTNGELREGLILHLDRRPTTIKSKTRDRAAEPAVAPHQPDISARTRRLVLNDLGVVHGSVPQNNWLVGGEDYLLIARANERSVDFLLKHSAEFSGGRGWIATPTIARVLRGLQLEPSQHLSKNNVVVLEVQVIGRGDGTALEAHVPAPADTPAGQWKIVLNGRVGRMSLEVDSVGDVSGHVLGTPVAGFWCRLSRKLSIMLSGVDEVREQQVFEGYFMDDGSAIAGVCMIFIGSGAVQGRTTIGWYATRPTA